MLQRLIAFSVAHAGPVTLGGALVLFAAGLLLPTMPVDVFPELNAPTVVVMTEAGGLAADEVEATVSFPIETAVNGLPGTRRVRSSSTTGLSIVWVEFEWGEDLFRARQLVSERLSAVREQLPGEAHAEIAPMTSITGEIMLLALTASDERTSLLDLRSYAEFDLRKRLLAIPGVAQVVAIGGQLPEYQVHCRQDRLRLYGLTVGEVAAAARAAHSTAPAGYLENVEHKELPIRQTARVQGVDDIRSTIVRYVDGAAVRIGDVADVGIGPAPKRGTAGDRGRPAVVVSVQKAPGTNTLALTEAVDRALDEATATLPPGVKLNREVFRAADFIRRSIGNVVVSLRDATIIVVVILILFLMNARTTLVTLTALPLSIALALILLRAFDISLNVMTLGGLAVAIGELVDDAIIDVENVFRRLRENRAKPESQRQSVGAVVFAASNEIRGSVVFATIIICMVFVPLLFLGGLEGRFFRPLGIAYITSILASLGVALTVTPALCRLVLRGRLAKDHGDGWLVRKLKALYEPLLVRAIRTRKSVLAVAAVVTVLSALIGSGFGSSFLPSFNEGTYTVFLMMPPGTSLVESDRIAGSVEARLVEIPGVRGVTRRTGRAERDEHAEPPSASEIDVTMREGADPAEVRRGIDAILAALPGVTTMIGQPIEHRLSHILSGTPAAISIDVFGEDLALLRHLAKEIEGELKSIPGTRDIAAHREVMVESLPIRYRARDLGAAGLTPRAAAEQVEDALYGQRVATISQGTRRLDLVVRLAPDERERIDQVASLVLRGAGGTEVRLSEVADIGPELTSNLVTREGARRKAVISTNVVEGRSLGDVVSEVRAKVEPIVAAAGCSVRFGGQFEAQQSASRTIAVMGLGVIVVMFVLLQLTTGSARIALLVMLNLPLALIGGIAAVFFSEAEDPFANLLALLSFDRASFVPPILSIASLVGFVTLFGIAVRNGILLVNHYRHLEEHEGVERPDAIVRGSVERLVPILMTALTAALGLLPLALSAGEPGSELLAPLAIVVLGGLATSTLLNLFVVPAGFALLFRLPKERFRASGHGATTNATHSPENPS